VAGTHNDPIHSLRHVSALRRLCVVFFAVTMSALSYSEALVDRLPNIVWDAVRPRVLAHGHLHVKAEVELAMLEWVWWFNNQRLHSELGYRTPTEVEAAYYADLEPPETATAALEKH
jgi:putative transposase